MEGRGRRNGCGCWTASCQFMSCLLPSCCSTGFRTPNSVVQHGDVGPSVEVHPAVVATDSGAPSNALALRQPIPEFTLEQLDVLIESIELKVTDLVPVSSSSSSHAKLDENKQICTSFIELLPKELTNEVAKNGRSLLMPLLAEALGGMGTVQWLGVGFTFIAWSLSNTEKVWQNREKCSGILIQSLELLKKTKQIWQLTIDDNAIKYEDFKDSIEKAFYCAIFCTSNLTEHWILSFVKAATIEDAIAALAEELVSATMLNMEFMERYNLQNVVAKVERQVTFRDSCDDIVGDRWMSAVMEDAVTFMEGGSQDRIKAVLLHGMGGIGKSTLGLRIFTLFQEKRAYRACRVELPLETQDHHLCDIQRQILEKISGHAASKFSNLTDGMQHMQKELKQISQPIFLYVDNVLESQYLSRLLPKASFFPEGSRLLITARAKYTNLVDLDISIESYKAIEVRKLPKQEAQQLLRKQLQSQGELRIDSKIESAEERVLALCDGLPLALVVVGKYIAASVEGAEINVEVWHEVVKAMENAESFDGRKHDELYSHLQFSIQNLDGNAKRAFLDVVFFIKDRPWIGYTSWKRVERLVGQKNLLVLSKRALLQIDEKSRGVEMHDVLKALGCKMVREDQQELRISGLDELNELDGSALNKVVALREVADVDVHRLKQMPHLRLLDHVRVMEKCEKIQLSRQLRVVGGFQCVTAGVCDWSKCASLKEVAWRGANEFDLEVFKHDNLSTTLEALSLDAWTQLKDVQVIETLTSLRELQLSDCCEIQSLPEEISQLTALQQLSLRWCRGLKCLPQGISRLLCLEGLHLVFCVSVQSLPDGLTCLTGLTQLDLRGCTSLQSIPEGIASLTGLTQLDLRECFSLQSIPEGIASLTGLTQLHLCGCGSLQSIPEGIASLTGLTQLRLNWCGRLQSIPEGIASLTGLTQLHLTGWRSLQSIPEGIASLTGLTQLDLRWCERLQSIPEGIASLTGLTELDLSGCERLQSIPEGIGNLRGVKGSTLEECRSLESIPEGAVSLMTGLTKLSLEECVSIGYLPESIGSCALLQSLDLTDCTGLESLPEAVMRLSNLTSLCLLGCKSLQRLPRGLGNSLTGLVELKLGKCANLDIGPLLEEVSCSMRELRVLQLSECQDFQSLPQAMVTTLSRLQELSLTGCAQFQSLPQGVANWTGLTTLDLLGCRNLQSLPEELTTMTAITQLNLSGCAGLQSLPPGIFTSLAALKELSLRGCLAGLQREELQGITSLVRLTGLEKLDLSECDHLLFLLSQQGLAALTHLRLSGCTSLQRLPEEVAALEKLEVLNLSGCRNLQSLSHLPQGAANRLRCLSLEGCGGLNQPLVWDTIASLTSLVWLDLSGWERMQVLPDQIANLTNLWELDLSECSSLRSLPESVLTNLTDLRTLALKDCQNLGSLPPGISRMLRLEELELSGCKNLESLPPGITSLVRLEVLDLSGCTSLALPEQLTHWMSGLSAGPTRYRKSKDRYQIHKGSFTWGAVICIC